VDQALVLFGPARRVFAQLARVQPGAQVEQDAVVALDHASGVHSTLVMSAVAAESGARFTLLGARGAYVKHGLDGQEAALKAGGDPHAPGWGEEPAEAWGTLTVGEEREAVPTRRGAYADFYAGVRDAIVDGAPAPVRAEEAVATADVIEAVFTSADNGTVVELT
jgi:predicted dehydrogenase